MATSRDIQEIISKLSSDKIKTREEGIKLLSSWLEGERAISFCGRLARNTAKMKPDEIPHDETWPFLLTLLVKCISLEISTSKKKPPKLIFAKTFRTAIQCAEDPKLSGKDLLSSVAKLLFNHIWDVIKDAPSFLSEYSNILRHILSVKKYCYQMRKRVYCSLIMLYMDKIELSVGMNADGQSSTLKEELFRCILTLHALLENPPGDFPANIREDVVKGFIKIFQTIRDEGKVPRKLMECVNVFLLRDGPNLGSLTMEIHSAIEDFIFRFWLTTHDRGLKNSLVNYARIMLLLYRRISDGPQFIEKLLDVITRELDQITNVGAGFLWSDMPRDDKMGTLDSNQQGLMELAAIVFYQACKNKRILQCQEKRLRMEHAADRIRDGLVKGSWLWKCAFCFLIHKFGCRINKSLLIYWFQGTNESLKRILNNSDTLHSPDLLLWLLRAFQELLTVLHLDPSKEAPHNSSFSLNEVSLVRNGWQDTWTCLMRGLPTFGSVTPVVEVCLKLLGDMISHDQVFGVVVPQELWDLRIFKKTPSRSALYFISCYFSRAGVQGDVRDVLHLRKDLLRAVLDSVDFKEPSSFNEHTVKLIPETVFSLCAGFGLFSPLSENIFISQWHTEESNKLSMVDGYDQDILDRGLDCSVESIAEIEPEPLTKAKANLRNSIQLPRQIKQPLIHEIKEHLTGLISSNIRTDGTNASVLIYKCSLLCNCIYWSILTRMREDNSFFTKIFDHVPEILDHIASIFQGKCNEIKSRSCLNIISVLESSGITMPSIRSLLSSQLFVLWKEVVNDIERELLGRVTEAIERLLVVLGELFDVFSYFTNDPDIKKLQQHIPKSYLEDDPFNEHRVQLVDVELDLGECSSDVDSSTGGSKTTSTSFAHLHWKSELASIISCFSSLFPARTWEILFGHIGKENDERVSQRILLTLCKTFPSTAGSLLALANLISTMSLMIDTSKCSCFNILICIYSLLEAFKSRYSKNICANECMDDDGLKENLNLLYNLLNKVSEIGVLDWIARVKLIDCVCCIVTLDPLSAQVMIERILAMLQDPDYRVRLFLAKRVAILFHTWDGHNELFHDICSSFGFAMVMASKEKTIKAGEVLDAGPLSILALETALITLTHVAASSDKVETEVVFMMCVIAAMEPYQRELVHALFDNLSRRLQYASRNKYLEQLFGSILAYWIACEVSLVTLIEIRDIFGHKWDVKYFLQYCCPWLLPPLILRGDIKSLNWISEVSGHALPSLVKEYFVPIFSSCMGVYCSSNRPDKDAGERALTKSILHFANISELERDDLIKRHMVSIVSHLFSLARASPDPVLPYFTKNAVVLSVQTVVDGFMEMDVNPSSKGIVDKINIFRPDRVFKFLVEMHFQIAASVSPRHMCHRLSAIEVLVDVIGPRATVSSVSYYIINIVGQFIQVPHLQELCCAILSKLLEAFKANCNKEVLNVLGEQLQLLVSKLVSCCIPSELQEERVDFLSARIISLLQELIVDADPLLYDYIRELEPFPHFDCLEKIRVFHDNLCRTYSPRDHFLKFVRKAFYLPKGLLLLRFQHLHKSLLLGEIIQRKSNAITESSIRSCWTDDPDVVSAVWMLVGLCGVDDSNAISGLLADFISRIGIGDPREIVFSLPRSSLKSFPFVSSNYVSFKEENLHKNLEVSDELVVILLRLLTKFLSDDSVKIVDVTSQTLRGILSTEKGHRALLSLDLYARSLIGVHSKGVNPEVVENSLLELEMNAEPMPLEDSSLWSTENKNFDTWICSLVHSLIRHSDDVMLRLCQNIVSLKAEAAEVLLSSVLVNLARKIDSDVSFCELISVKVKEKIFIESNSLLRSIQAMLDSLNKLRSCYVTEKMGFSVPVKQPKGASFGKTRSTSMKSKGHVSNVVQNSLWKKVYWLSIDYLVAAKAAIHCGLYFTAILYIEYWCEEHFNGLQLGSPDMSDLELLPPHIDVLVAACTQINEPDSIYGIIQSNKLKSQIITSEHEGNWSKALEYYDLLVRSSSIEKNHRLSGGTVSVNDVLASSGVEEEMGSWKLYKGLMRSLQKTGCTHVLDAYCQGLVGLKSYLQYDPEFIDLQYEAAWRAGNWDFTFDTRTVSKSFPLQYVRSGRFNESLHSCLRAFQEGDTHEFHLKLMDAKKDLMISVSSSSRESIEYIHSTIVKLQILDHLGLAWDIRWKPYQQHKSGNTLEVTKVSCDPVLPTKSQLNWLNVEWSYIIKLAQLHLNMYEPFIAFRHVLLRTIDCKECTLEHLLESASTLRKGSRFSLAASALHELKQLCFDEQASTQTYFLARLEEAKLLRAQGQHDMAINLASHIAQSYSMGDNLSNVYRLVGKWLAETRSSNSSVILEKYLKHSVELSELSKGADKESAYRQCQTYYHLAHYADSIFKSYEERLASSEWQAAMRLRKHKARELDALVKRLRSSSKGDKTDYATKIHELQKQLKMDSEEAEKLQVDRDNFLNLALEGYQRSLSIGGKYDLKVVFRLVSLWFNYFSAQNVVMAMMTTVKEVQSYKFIPLVYQIASRLGSTKDGQGSTTFQTALSSLVRKMAIDHPYHTIFQLLALSNGDRVKDKQRSRNSFIVDMDKKVAAENLLNELARYHGALIQQMKQLVEVYIKLAELETRKEETNKKVPLPREIRSLRQLELVPVITATIPVDLTCQYGEGSFPHFKGLADSIMIMNGINAPKVVECYGSDGHKYRQLAKSGNDDLRQDAVMEQFFGLVNSFLENHRDTWKRRLRIRTYKVVPFTPSAGVLEWVDRTLPLGEYLLGSTRNGGAHSRYGNGDWSFLQCRECMINEKDKRKAFNKVCDNFRPVMHFFFLERFLQPADWFKNRLSYTRSVAVSSMVGYIVGLGDRHSMNILIDQETAEVVHIDLGVAFEQGLMLKTPERVPFRLTRDIIDGMGITGVEGVFRKCCEETLSVMRTNKEALLTIIEVFIHDPLYKWALSPLKALQRQKESDDDIHSFLENSQDAYEGNMDAARATLRVKQKLDGYEMGEMRSVQGQVQQLIQDAVDIDRLCHMFPGWGAWL